MKLVLVLLLVGVIGGGVVVAWQNGLIPTNLNVPSSQEESLAYASEQISSIDQSLATQIRQWREKGWQPPEILGSVSSEIDNASVSATITTTPGEVWQSFREQGAQAALGNVARSAEVSVNSVSNNVVNEARYQYCLGVVESYKQE